MNTPEEQDDRLAVETVMAAINRAVAEQDRLQYEHFRVGFSQCQEELIGVRQELAHVRQTLMVYQESATLRAKQHVALEKKVENQDLHILELVAQVAMLQSVIMNQHEDSAGGSHG